MGMEVVLKPLALAVIVALAVVLLLFKDGRGRLGLKTLLFIMTLAAVLLGVLVILSQ